MKKMTKFFALALLAGAMVSISLLCTAWMMHPAPKKSRALNMACVNRWNILAM